MKSKSTFSILIWINNSRATNNEAELFLRITINQKRANISLKKKVKVDLWDSKRNRMKGNSQDAKILNLYLDRVKSKVFDEYQKLQLENKLVTAELLKSRFIGEDDKSKSIIDLFIYHNRIEANKLNPDTLKSYLTTQNYLTLFIKSKLKTDNIFISELNYQFILDFEDFLRNYRSVSSVGYLSNNTVMKHIKRLKKMVRLALELEWINKDPFIRFKIKIEKKERTYLTMSELKQIQNFETKILRLQLVKDIFLFSCYTGLTYVDVMNLNTDNLRLGIDRNKWLITTRQKSKTPVKIPLLPIALDLINKYQNHFKLENENQLFPHFSNQKLNAYLKEIADICGINKNLTFHMARHTFATTITLTNGMPIETVSKLLGHTKITTTQIYAKIIDEKVSLDMNQLQSVLNNVS